MHKAIKMLLEKCILSIFVEFVRTITKNNISMFHMR